MNQRIRNLIDSIRSVNWKLVLETSFWLSTIHVCCMLAPGAAASALISSVMLAMLLRYLDALPDGLVARSRTAVGFGHAGTRRFNARA